jgi:hypothetical protein
VDEHDVINCIVSGILVFVGLWLIFGRHPKRWRKQYRLLGRPVTPLLLLLLLGLILVVQTGALMFIWPSYSERNLLGLTPDEVINRLGKPSMDPRRLGWREDRDGPLFLNYGWNWTTTSIKFENGHAVQVRQYGK